METLTKEIAFQEARSLWIDLERTGNKWKRSWAGWENYLARFGWAPYLCPLCHYALLTSDSLLFCSACPVKKWGDKVLCSMSENDGLYNKWDNANTIKKRKAAAHKIVLVIEAAIKEQHD